MKITRHNVWSYYDYNRGYNLAIKAALQNILQHQDVRPLGYRASRDTPQHSLLRPSKYARKVTQAPSQVQKEIARFDIADLASYERVVFACCAWGDYDTYVITGEMGSGKTALARFIRTVLKRKRADLCGSCHECEPTVIYRDFNRYAHVDSVHELRKLFKEDLVAAVLPVVVDIFGEAGRVDNFRRHVLEEPEDEEFVRFLDFDRSVRRLHNWSDLTDPQKAEVLADYVRSRPALAAPEERSVDAKLLYCTTLLSYIRARIRRDPACCVFIFDNLDGVRPDAQLSLLQVILATQSTSHAKTLVPLRLTTFERWETQAAFVFGHIDHIGPGPMEIVQQRLAWWSDHWEEQPSIQALEEPYRAALRRRLEYVRKVFASAPRTVEALSALAGASVRLGLYLMERAFSNAVIKWDSDPYYVSEIPKCVLIDNSGDSLDVSLDDQYTTNLFADPDSNDFSLLSLRLLQMTYSLKSTASERTVGSIVEAVECLNAQYTPAKVRIALNCLLFEKSPLMWVDARAGFTEDEDLTRRTEVVSATEGGSAYMVVLLHDLVYIQECFMSVSWPDGRVPLSVDYRREEQRFRALYACLECLLEADRTEVERYLAARKSNNVRLRLDVELISNRIMRNVARSFLGITSSREEGVSVEVLKSWRSMVVTGFNNEYELLKRDNVKLTNLAVDFDEAIKSAAAAI